MIDKRTKPYRMLKTIWANRGTWLALWLIIFIAFSVLLATIVRAMPVKLLDPRGSGSVRVVQEVQAADNPLVYPSRVAEAIRGAESTWGRAKAGHHVECRLKGKTNEYGFNPLNGFCFDNKDTAKTTVELWLSPKMLKWGFDKTVCYYRYGKLMNTCDYAGVIRKLIK